jgi:hypothetical protein
MSRIDMVFYTPGWEDLFRNPVVQPLSSGVSDHCPLLVTPISFPNLRPTFKFESFWTGMEGFYDCVKEAWWREVPGNQNDLATLHIRLSRIAKSLKSWSKNLMSREKIAMSICREVIAQLDKAQESRNLTGEERTLHKTLKQRLLGLAAIEKSRARRQSRVTWMKKGDANTKFFHIMANTRRKKIFITFLETNTGIALTQSDKHGVIYSHFL